ncbi:MAG: hypothetical protein FJ143_08660 [Deltaproteobacteria bacterium]|nr:hypothetical protein [Deltaproteobacteria bacterium]
MSYMRGDTYIWSDGTHVHFWARDGYDEWDQAGWHDPNSTGNPSGVALPQAIADEYVVMRMAEMIDEGCVTVAIEHALEKFRGNGGCIALANHADLLRRMVKPTGS